MEQNEMTCRIMDAMREPRYSDVRESDRLSGLARLLYDEYARKGQSATGTDELAYRLDRDIRDYYGRQVTPGEVQLALRWGLRGEYGEFTGLNADRLFRFIRSYIESPERQEAVRRSYVPSPAQRQLTAEERGLQNWNAMLGEFRSEVAYWRGHRQVEAVHPAEDTLVQVRRTITAMCYRWLKGVGLVSSDASTLEVELEKTGIAARTLKREGCRVDAYSEAVSAYMPSPVRSLAHSMMMEEYFLNAEAAGLDLDSVLSGLESTPEGRRRWYD